MNPDFWNTADGRDALARDLGARTSKQGGWDGLNRDHWRPMHRRPTRFRVLRRYGLLVFLVTLLALPFWIGYVAGR